MTTTKKRFLHTGWLAALLAFALAVPTLQAAAESNFQIGVGANYWVALEDAVDESFDEDGLGWMISSRYMFTPYFGLGLELERSPDNYIALEEPIYCPALYLILGKVIYAGLGVGTYFYDGDFIEDAFYALRAGLALEMLPRWSLISTATTALTNGVASRCRRRHRHGQRDHRRCRAHQVLTARTSSRSSLICLRHHRRMMNTLDSGVVLRPDPGPLAKNLVAWASRPWGLMIYSPRINRNSRTQKMCPKFKGIPDFLIS